jgi:exosortase/archaeosortase family protein
MWRSLAIFLLCFFGLQLGWSLARGTRLEHWVVDCATVRTSVALINTLTPRAAAVASGPSVVALGGRINVRNGCEGTEVLFLLLAALLAYPFSWRLRAVGAVAGAAFVFLINQARLLALFYSIRNDRALFDQLHGVIAPGALVLATLLFFAALQRWERRSRVTPGG